ncbi:MAG: GntR family transcriptional regulator [Caldilineaceae bacterium]|nr:GntR family transcriptional regulator [Caldilineaceae bacterium]
MPTQIALSKKEYVYRTLKEEIVSGALEPDERLVIDEVSQRLGTSAIPVREALQQLRADGFVVIEPYTGVRVAPISAGIIEEVFALLEAAEIISSRIACRYLTDADFAQIETILRRMDENAASGDLAGWTEDNRELHLFICDRAGLSLLPVMLSMLLTHWSRFCHFYLYDVIARRIQTAQAEHWALLETLRTRDASAVAKLIQRHNRGALEDYQRYLQTRARPATDGV